MADAKQHPIELPKISLFGDSLTEWSFFEWHPGFGYELQQRYARKAEVLNRGKAGYTSTMLKPYFASIISEVRRSRVAPLFVTILVGTNDSSFGDIERRVARVPMEEYVTNLRTFVDATLTEEAMGDAKIVLITPPPINVKRHERANWEDLDPQAREESASQRAYRAKREYAEAVMQLAGEYAVAENAGGRVRGLNLWKAIVDFALQKDGMEVSVACAEGKLPGSGLPDAEEFTEDIFTDGLHLGVTGYQILSMALLDLLAENWPEVLAENRPDLLPGNEFTSLSENRSEAPADDWDEWDSMCTLIF